MKIFASVEQGSQEWKDLRTKYFTASALGDWLTEDPQFRLNKGQIRELLEANGHACPPEKAKLEEFIGAVPFELYAANLSFTDRRNDAWENAIEKRLGSISFDDEPEKDTWAMKRGRELEPEARVFYENYTGQPTVKVGFCAHDSDDFGNSPDSLVLREHCRGWEIKDGEFDESIFRNGTELKCHVARVHIRFLRRGGFREEHALQVHASMAATGIREWHLFGYHPELPPLFEKFEWDDTTERVLSGLMTLSEDYWRAYAELKSMYQSQTPEGRAVA